MLLLPLLIAATASVQTPPPAPQVTARAQVQAVVRIIQAAEVRDGRTFTPHQRTIRHDDSGAAQIVLQFE